MPPAKTVGAYADIAEVFETLARENTFPATYELPTKKDAVQWRHRAHAYRSLLRRNESIILGLPLTEGTSLYDSWELTLDGAKVIIKKRLNRGILTIGGETVTPKTNARIEAEDEL